MYPRNNYEMTQADLDKIYEACQPVPVMMIGGQTGPSVQENANRAWQSLGQRMGFDHMTVRPINGKGDRFFTAIPSETEERRAARLDHEEQVKRQTRAATLQQEIKERQAELDALVRETR